MRRRVYYIAFVILFILALLIIGCSPPRYSLDEVRFMDKEALLANFGSYEADGVRIWSHRGYFLAAKDGECIITDNYALTKAVNMIRNVEVIVNDEITLGTGSETSPKRKAVDILSKDGRLISRNDTMSFPVEKVYEICLKVKDGMSISDAIGK